MNVLFLTHYSSLYGANRSLINMIEGLKTANDTTITPLVIVPEKGDLTKWLKEHHVNYKIIHFALSTQAVPHENGIIAKLRTWQHVKRQAFKRLAINIKACKMVIPLIDEYNIDVIYSNSSVISIGWWLKKWTKKLYVLHIRELREAHYNFQPDWGKRLFHKHLKDTDSTIAISKTVQEYYTLPTANIIYNGIFFNDSYPVPQVDERKTATFTFGIIGLIHPNKGQLEAIKAVNSLINQNFNVKLLIAGTGDTSGLETYIKSHNLEEHIHFLGYIERPNDFYKMVDATIVASRYEALGRVTIESMLIGVPVLGLNHSGTAELIKNNQTGFLFNDNQISLEGGMKKVIGLTSIQKNKIISEAFDYASKNFSIELYTTKIINLLSNLKTIN